MTIKAVNNRFLSKFGPMLIVGLLLASLLTACSNDEAQPAPNPSPNSTTTTGPTVSGTTASATSGAASSTTVNSTTTVAATASPTPKVDPAKIPQQLDDAWAYYRTQFIQGDGRVVDPMPGGITTSEGQSYGLLRSVWQNDQDTFKRVLNWTNSNLQYTRGDKLFAYKWGKLEDGNWRVIDKANATDGDTDIALALLMAAKRWNDDSYKKEALEILKDLWDKSVVTVQNKPYMTAGEWAAPKDKAALNPSYLAPYAYRVFATVDPDHNWAGLVDTSYEVIQSCSEITFDGSSSAYLPPNWCSIEKSTGKLGLPEEYPSLNTNYGYDAFRTYWRLALDYKWNGEKRAADYLNRSSFLRDKYKSDGKLATEYDHTGKVVKEGEDLSIYGGTLANFIVADKTQADKLAIDKLASTYRKNEDNDPARAYAAWGEPRNYYNQNWVWFGLALYADKLPNLTK